MSLTKTYELSIIHSDPAGENKDVVYVSFFEIVGATKKLVAQQQFNPHTVPITQAGDWAEQVAGALVRSAFIGAAPPLTGTRDPGGNEV